MKNINFYLSFLIILFLIVISNSADAQISHGGIPPSFTEKSISNSYDIIEFSEPEMGKIAEQDKENAGKKDVIRRIGKIQALGQTYLMATLGFGD